MFSNQFFSSLRATLENLKVVNPRSLIATVLLPMASLAVYSPQTMAQKTVSLPDLVVSSASMTPVNPATGQSVLFSLTIKNQGNAASLPGVVIGASFLVDGKKVSYAFNEGMPLAAGASVTLKASSTVRWVAVAGAHKLTVVADDLNRIQESNENNNSYSQNFSVATPSFPDLIVSSVRMTPATPAAGQSVLFSLTIKNQGTAATPQGVVIGAAFFVDGKKASYAFNDGTNLAPGASLTLTSSSSVPWIAVGGTHSLTAVADDSNRMQESNENNNASSQNFNVATPISTTDSNLNAGLALSYVYNAARPNQAINVNSALTGQPIWTLYTDAYAITQGSGQIVTTYKGSSGGLTTSVALSGVNPAVVNAYPFISLGNDAWGYSNPSQGLTFPAQLSALNSMVIDVNYSLSGNTANIDVLFDEWLIPTRTSSGGQAGSVEVEILPFNSILRNGYWGTFIKTFTIPVVLNGQATTMNFLEYAAQATGSGGGKGPGTTILFYPVTLNGLSGGDLQFDSLLLLKEAAATSTVGDSWYVSGIFLGTEFGNYATSFNYTFNLNKLLVQQNFK